MSKHPIESVQYWLAYNECVLVRSGQFRPIRRKYGPLTMSSAYRLVAVLAGLIHQGGCQVQLPVIGDSVEWPWYVELKGAVYGRQDHIWKGKEPHYPNTPSLRRRVKKREVR